jgi:hypothetical protein
MYGPMPGPVGRAMSCPVGKGVVQKSHEELPSKGVRHKKVIKMRRIRVRMGRDAVEKQRRDRYA